MDKIKIENLEVYACHGVFPEEKKLGQKFLVSVDLFTSTREAGNLDDLESSVHYGEVSHFITDYMKEHTFALIETVAENLARELLLHYFQLEKIRIEVKKPWAPIGLPVEYVAVEIVREWHTAYIALGSNIGDKGEYLLAAVDSLRGDRQCRVEKVSGFIETAPYGVVEQDKFLNGCLKLRTLLTPEELLNKLHEIEHQSGRERTIHWGPRTLDLDIIFYDDLIFGSDDLCIPHVDMHNRRFVLEPLDEIAPYLHHPVTGKTVREMLNELK